MRRRLNSPEFIFGPGMGFAALSLSVAFVVAGSATDYAKYFYAAAGVGLSQAILQLSSPLGRPGPMSFKTVVILLFVAIGGALGALNYSMFMLIPAAWACTLMTQAIWIRKRRIESISELIKTH